MSAGAGNGATGERGTVALIDYGAGNLHSVRRALEAAGARVVRASSPEPLLAEDRAVLPGVGAFGAAMAALRQSGLDEAIGELVRAGKPLLGICLGLQLLVESSAERGTHRGLGLLPGEVLPIPAGPTVPHMGWQDLHVTRPGPLLRDGFPAYFAHSYYLAGDHPDSVATVDHGVSIAAAIHRDNVFACQFHPEKSSAAGLELLGRFLEA